MQDKLLQTPDGVRDTYGTECEKKEIFLLNSTMYLSCTVIMI